MAQEQRAASGATECPGVLFILDVRPRRIFEGKDGPWPVLLSSSSSSQPAATASAATAEATPTNNHHQQALFTSFRLFNIPFAELESRAYEMPAKRCAVFVCGETTEQCADVIKFLGNSWHVVGVASNTSNNGDDSRLISWSTASPAQQQQLLRAWSPSPFIEQHIPAILQSHLASTSAMIAVDVGSGNGRDVAYLASLGYTCVFALDNRRHLLENSVALAGRQRRQRRQRDRSDGPASIGAVALETHVTNCLPLREGSVDLIICVRFLERGLLPVLCRYLAVGGALMYSHFVDGVQHSAVGTPRKPSQFVMHGELRKMCVENAVRPKSMQSQTERRADDDGDDDDQKAEQPWLKVLLDEEALLVDGRPVANLIVVRVC